MDGSPLVYSSLVACDGGDHHATWMAVLLSIVARWRVTEVITTTWMAVLLSIVAWWRVTEVITTTWMAVLLSIVAWWRVTEVITTLHGWQSSCL